MIPWHVSRDYQSNMKSDEGARWINFTMKFGIGKGKITGEAAGGRLRHKDWRISLWLKQVEGERG